MDWCLLFNTNVFMSWITVANKHKKRFKTDYVICMEPYEKTFIITTILEEFPSFSKVNVEAAYKNCCQILTPPRIRTVFFSHLRNQLG